MKLLPAPWVAAATVLLLLGCPDPRRTDPVTPAPVTTLDSWSAAQWNRISEADTGVSRPLSFQVDVGTTPADLYLVFTNTSPTGGAVSLASLAVPDGARSAGTSGGGTASGDGSGPFLDRPTAAYQRTGGAQVFSRSAVVPAVSPPVYAVGDALSFEEGDSQSGYRTLPSHLRYKAGPYHGRTVYLWVSDDVWTSAATSGRPDAWAPGVTSVPGLTRGFSNAMATAYGAKFLNSSSTDIYSSVTAIFGREWSESGSPPSGLIDGFGQIHILVANLNPQGSTSYPAGYFFALHNYPKDSSADGSHSNEKLKFFLHADELSRPDSGQPWSIQAGSPRYMVSALAHEFQHMIHFYQKQVVAGGGWSDAWVNEMSSMVAEDLVSDRIAVEGPRGVLLKNGAFDYSAGSSATNWGRLNQFVGAHETVSLTEWGTLSHASYANAYAFGAWLVRNYGGPALFRQLVQSPGGDAAAVVSAVNLVNSTGETFGSLVRNWGLATLLQSSSGSPERINWGLTATSGVYQLADPIDNTTRSYRLGSINLSRYDYVSGKAVVTGVSYSLSGDTPPALPSGASWFQRRLTRATGPQSLTLAMPAHIEVTAVQLR